MRSKQTMLFCSIDQSATSWQSHRGENRYPRHPHTLASDCPALNQIIRLVQHDIDYDLRFCYFFNFSLPVRLASVKSDWPRWSDWSWLDWIDLRVISTRFRIIVGLRIKVEMAQMMMWLNWVNIVHQHEQDNIFLLAYTYSSWHFFLYLKYVRSNRTNQLNFKCICSSLSLKSACDERWWPFKWEKKSWWPVGTGRAQIVSFLNSPRSRKWQAGFSSTGVVLLVWDRRCLRLGQDFCQRDRNCQLIWTRLCSQWFRILGVQEHPEHQYTQRDKRSFRYKQMNIQLGVNLWQWSCCEQGTPRGQCRWRHEQDWGGGALQGFTWPEHHVLCNKIAKWSIFFQLFKTPQFFRFCFLF